MACAVIRTKSNKTLFIVVLQTETRFCREELFKLEQEQWRLIHQDTINKIIKTMRKQVRIRLEVITVT